MCMDESSVDCLVLCHNKQDMKSKKISNDQELIQSDPISCPQRGARWLSGRVSDSGARGPGFETYRRRVVSLSKTLYSPKVLVPT